jgi:hypothetical protein
MCLFKKMAELVYMQADYMPEFLTFKDWIS